jgi:uncharacterized protein YbjT (DUF2867 family)
MAMILVVGGTGDLGGRVVRLLCKEGVAVRCLVRAGSDDAELRELGVTIVRGDLTQPTTLAAACDGVGTVVATATVIARRLAGARRPTLHQVDQDGMTALIDAAESAGVERFVYMSYPGAESCATPLDRAKRANERRLSESSMRTTVVRSDAFQEIHLGPLARFDIAAGKIAIIGHGDSAQRWVGTDDVAALVAAVTTEPEPPATVTVGGPEAMSKNEAVELVEAETGRRMKVRRMPRPVARLVVRALQRRNDAMASVIGLGLMQDLRPAYCDDRALTSRGINPRSASEFLREQSALHA